MLNVLLADDEYLVRVMLKNCVDWNEMGFRIIGEVDKGDQILPACQAMHPDLLLLDINMPIISGLDAVSYTHLCPMDHDLLLLHRLPHRCAVKSAEVDHLKQIPMIPAGAIEQFQTAVGRGSKLILCASHMPDQIQDQVFKCFIAMVII